MAKRRTGIDPLAYMGVEPSTPAQFVVDNRDPTTNDYDNFNLQAVWLNKSTHGVWMLVDKANFIATWIQFTSNVSAINTLTGNIGGAVPATAGNIDVVGAGFYVFTGNPGTSTLTLTDDGSVATTYAADSGSAIPVANILNIVGGTGVTTSAAGNTITIDASLSNLEIQTDAGVNVSPSGSILEVIGGDNITTTGIAPNIVQVAVSGTTNHAIQVGNASGSLTSVGPLSTGELLIGVTGSDPNPARLTAGSNITIDDTSTPGEIVISSIGGGGGAIIAITKFTSSGNFTKNVNTSYMDVIVWSAGSGGGSGRQGASTSAGGGNSGLVGTILTTSVYATLFDVTETVIIPAGALGGAAQTVANTNGNDGASAGYSSIGNLFVSPNYAGGTLGGLGGITGINNQNPSSTLLIYDDYLEFFTFGTRGRGRNTNGDDAGTPLFSTAAISRISSYAGSNGGGGGGADSVTERSGGNGGNIYAYATGATSPQITLSAGGTAGLESIAIDGGNGNDMISTTGGRFVAATGGGGGGGQSIGLAAGNGGNGGIPGTSGGGGGGSLNGTNSGAGGDGTRGEIWVIEYA